MLCLPFFVLFVKKLSSVLIILSSLALILPCFFGLPNSYEDLMELLKSTTRSKKDEEDDVDFSLHHSHDLEGNESFDFHK